MSDDFFGNGTPAVVPPTVPPVPRAAYAAPSGGLAAAAAAAAASVAVTDDGPVGPPQGVSSLDGPVRPDAPASAPVAAGLPTAAPYRPQAPAPVTVPVAAQPAYSPPAAQAQPSAPSYAPPAPAAEASHGTASGPVAVPGAADAAVVTVAERAESDRIVLDDLLKYLLEADGSDLHLSVGAPPAIRARGEMASIPGYGALTPETLREAIYEILTSKQREKFEEHLELDLAYTLPGYARFRVNVLRQRGSVGAVMRVIPWEIKTLEQLGMPPSISAFAALPRGFVLVTGPTGSGKSTTLAALVDKANRTRRGHIMTIEDPIEFLHQHRSCVVNQREIGEDTISFASALKHVLRQDPDIILVGELRDLETISVALTAAETGHLVFATLHTQSAAETVTRIIDVFPPAQQQQVRTQLASSLQGIVCQQLCKTADGKGRVAAVEVLVATPGIRSMIREGKLAQIPSALQAGAKFGMQTLDSHLAQYVREQRITMDTAVEKCNDLESLQTLAGVRH